MNEIDIYEAVKRMKETSVEPIENICYECGLLLSREFLYGGNGPVKPTQSDKPCQYQLCYGCLKNYCESQVFERKKFDAALKDEQEPEYCKCKKCQNKGNQ